MKSDRLRWLKSVDNNLKLQPNISGNTYLISGDTDPVDGAFLVEPSAVVDAFAKHFQSVYNNHCPMDPTPLSQSSELLSHAHISDADICKAIKRLKPSKSVGFDVIPGFIIKKLFSYFYSYSDAYI
jgi:hypothetical protein